MYTLAEFRANLRKAFNDADEGHDVLIERYGQTYQLVSLVGEPNADGTYHKGPVDTEEEDGTPIKNEPRVSTDYKTCKLGHSYRGDKCLQKGH